MSRALTAFLAFLPAASAGVGTAEDRCAATLRLGGMSQVGYEADSELFLGVLRRRKDTTGPAVSAD
jgi:hypothetical protein